MNNTRNKILKDNISKLDLTKNECLFPTLANEIVENIKITSTDIIKYHSSYDVDNIIADQVAGNGFVFSNSGSECTIKQVFETLTKESKNWVIPIPTFELSFFYCNYYNCKIETPKYFYDNSFSINLKDIKNKKTKILYLVSPHNPTGITLSDLQIIQFCKEYKYVVIDQAYQSPKSEIINTLNVDNLILIRSFSKLGIITGLRFGYGVCFSEDLYNKLNQIRPMYLNSITLKYVSYIFTSDILTRLEEQIENEVQSLSLKYKKNIVSKAGNFLLFNKNVPHYRTNPLKAYNFNSNIFYRMTVHEKMH